MAPTMAAGGLFRPGLRERIASSSVTGEDAAALAQALLPLATGDAETAGTLAVVEEWCRAVADAPAEGARRPPREGWHVFAEDGPRGPARAPGWHRPPDPWNGFESAGAPGSARGAAGPRDGPSRGLESVLGVSPLGVTTAVWTRGVVAQSSPFPGGDNVISVTFSANVPLGPASPGDDGSSPIACWLQISGLQPYAPPGKPGTRVAVEGSAAPCLAPSPDEDTREGVWEPGGAVRVYLRGILQPGVAHTVGIRVTNPPEPFAAAPIVEIEAGGSVCVPRMPLRVALRAGGEDGDDDEEEGASVSPEGLRVARPRFEVAKVVQSSFFPGSTNRLSVTFSTNVALAKDKGGAGAVGAGEAGAAGAGAARSTRLVITGLTGSQTPDSNLSIEPDEGSGDVVGVTGQWLQQQGSLEVPILRETVAGKRYTFSFRLCNPPSACPSAGAYIGASDLACCFTVVVEAVLVSEYSQSQSESQSQSPSHSQSQSQSSPF